MMPKATVVEVYRGRAIIMTEECEFKEIRTSRPLQPGEEIEYPPGEIHAKPRSVRAVALVASFIICCLLTYSTWQHLVSGRVYGCIGLDINPSLEISINRDFRVVKARSFNQDGRQLINSGQPVGSNLETALSKIVRQSKGYGYLHNTGNLIGVSIYSEPENNRHLLGRVDRSLNRELARNQIRARVYYFTVDKKTREQAAKQRVSPLRYLLWQKAREQGLSLDWQEITLRNPVVQRIARQTAARVGLRGQATVPVERLVPPAPELPVTPAAPPGELSDPRSGPLQPARQSAGTEGLASKKEQGATSTVPEEGNSSASSPSAGQNQTPRPYGEKSGTGVQPEGPPPAAPITDTPSREPQAIPPVPPGNGSRTGDRGGSSGSGNSPPSGDSGGSPGSVGGNGGPGGGR